MRLSDVLSKPPKQGYTQVDGFLQNKQGNVGQKAEIAVGEIALNYYCTDCDDWRTFYSPSKLSCIFIKKNIISIDCVLVCKGEEPIPIWFLIESDGNITVQAPNVRILKKCEALPNVIRGKHGRYGSFTELLYKAEQAHDLGLGAGSLVYLRKVFEIVTIQTANAINIEYKKYQNGNPKNFNELLTIVDKQCHIIPKEFSKNSYQLFRELSNVVHGGYDEELGVKKFEPAYRLVVGIFENIKIHDELIQAATALGLEEAEND